MEKEEDKIIVGLDIGTTKICVVVAQMNEHGKLHLRGIATDHSDGLMKGLITNIDKTVDCIIRCIKKAEEIAEVNIGLVHVGISCPNMKVLNASKGEILIANTKETISVADLETLRDNQTIIVDHPNAKLLHVFPKEYLVGTHGDHKVKDPVGMPGNKLQTEFHVVIAPEMALERLRRCVKNAGLECGTPMFTAFAAALSVLTEEEKEAGVALVDIGAGTVDVAVYHDGIIRHSCIIPLGANTITADIKSGLGLMESQAEQVKLKYGHALPHEVAPEAVVVIEGLRNRSPRMVSQRALAEVINSRMEDIFNLVHGEIIFSGYENKLTGGIVLTGGGARLQGVKHLCEFITGLDTRIGLPVEHLAKTEFPDAKLPDAAVAIGLALSGFRSVDERENAYATLKTLPKTETGKKKQAEKENENEFGFVKFAKRLGKKMFSDPGEENGDSGW